MAKSKQAFVCQQCGADYNKWHGQCSECKEWNSLTEVRGIYTQSSSSTNKRVGFAGIQSSQVQTLGNIELSEFPRLSTGLTEFDRVLGGGLVAGSSILLGGHPGAGKSTLLLQVLCGLAPNSRTLYVTGEESPQQIAMRAKRLQLDGKHLQILAETSVEAILAQVQKQQPKILVIDSIQVMHIEEISSAPGSVSQVREAAAALVRYAKQSEMVLIMVGHVTKEGSLAGPKVLEHMIDCFMMLEGDGDARYRTLRGQKNRFGAVNELGIFAMTELGLKEVNNPSAIFLSRFEGNSAGSLVMAIWEGTRPLMVELQALVDSSPFTNPRRVVVGIDNNRLAMLLAVLHRHGDVLIANQDVFINVVGGVKVTETSADLPLLLGVVSSLHNRPIAKDCLCFGEVGLAGEIRPVANGQERLREATKHGFKKAIIPHANQPKKAVEGMQVLAVRTLSEALSAMESFVEL